MGTDIGKLVKQSDNIGQLGFKQMFRLLIVSE